MNKPILVAAVLFLSSFIVACERNEVADQTAKKLRTLQDGALVSLANPAMRLKPDDAFDYAGSVTLTIKGIALAERHHWVVADEGRVKKLIIVQFEGFLDDADGQYNIALPSANLSGANYKFSPERIELGDKSFVHNTWAFDNAASARDNPGLEAAATLNILTDKGYAIDGELIMSRFGAALGDDRRHELIIFYIEPVADHGWTLADFPDGDPLTEKYELFSNSLTKRSLVSFDITFQSQ